MKTQFAILDGSSLFFRAFYALQLPPNARGVHTNAVHGFAMMLVKLLKELAPEQIVIAFDKSRTTFRTEIYPDYKGTRDKTPEELTAQIPLLKELAEALGIPFLERDHYEADDIIGTLGTQAADEGTETAVVTGDRDALQLIRPHLTVMLTKKGISEMKSYDAAVFEEEYGFVPGRLIDMKGLMGDSSDNIPGVPGIGPKTATKLLIAYGSIENVLDHAVEVSGKKLSTSLIEYRDQALLSKALATIECNVPKLRYQAEDFRMRPDLGALEAFCREYELRTVWRTLSDYLKPTAAASAAVEQSLFAENTAAAVPDLMAADLDAADMEALRAAEEIAVGAVFGGTAPFVRLEALALVYGDACRIVRAGTAHFDAVTALRSAPLSFGTQSATCMQDFRSVQMPLTSSWETISFILRRVGVISSVQHLRCAGMPRRHQRIFRMSREPCVRRSLPRVCTLPCRPRSRRRASWRSIGMWSCRSSPYSRRWSRRASM